MNDTANTTGSASPHRGMRRLSLKQYIAYGGGDAANNVAFSLAVSFLPLYYTDVAGISPAVVGALFLVMRFVDAFTDILMGSFIDRSNSRFGKFRPWILFGSVPLVALALANFAVPSALHGTVGAVVWAAIAYFLLGSVAYTAVNIPYGSLAASMTDNSRERSRLAVFRTVGSSIMQVVLAITISPALQEYQGDPAGLQSALIRTIIPLGVLAIGLYVFLFVVARENVERKVARVSVRDSFRTVRSNRALQVLGVAAIAYLAGMFGALGIISYYTRDVLGDARLLAVFLPMVQGAVIIIAWVVPPLATRLGKPRLFQLSAAVGAVGALMLLLAPADMLWFSILGAFVLGAGSGGVSTLLWSMEADTVEFGEWRTGYRSEGTSYAVFSFMRKLAQALGGALGVWIIGWFGYDGNVAEQSDSAVFGIRIAMGLLPAISMILALIVMAFFPMKDSMHAQILSDLEERKGVEPNADPLAAKEA